jgi:NAD(P)H-hydrate repair Nnr-like enzyme with NAD(P)H-hydrate epimerase domain
MKWQFGGDIALAEQDVADAAFAALHVWLEGGHGGRAGDALHAADQAHHLVQAHAVQRQQQHVQEEGGVLALEVGVEDEERCSPR